MLSWLVAAVLALAPAPAPARADVVSYSDFSAGLNTRNSGILLKDGESPALGNVVLDENGGVSRRKGYSKINSSAIGGGSSDVNAVYQLEVSGGTKYCVAFSSTNGYVSTDACASFSTFVSTLTRNSDVSCAPQNDKLYCVNNQYNFSYGGADDAPIASAPSDLAYIRLWRNRCFAAGKDSNPSRLYWSNIGDCGTWTTSTDYVDIDAEDGDIITGIGEDLNNFLPIYKKYSTYLLQFDNAFPANRKVINVSKSIGAVGHRAISNFDNRQFFFSVGQNGGQPGVYVTDGIHIEEDTARLRGSIDQLSTALANTGRHSIDTKSDWDAGTFDRMAMSSSRDSGFMQSSYTSHTDTAGVDFASGTLVNVSTQEALGSVVLSSNTAYDDFSDSYYDVGATTWTTASGWYIAGWTGISYLGTASPSTFVTIYTVNNPISSGSWSWDYLYADGLVGIDPVSSFKFQNNAAGDYYSVDIGWISGAGSCTTASVSLVKKVSGTRTVLAGYTTSPCLADKTPYRFLVKKNGSGDMWLYQDGVFKSSATDTAITTSIKLEINARGDGGQNQYWSHINWGQYNGAGTLTSQIYDTYISSPVWGPFTVVHSSDAASTITYQVQSSTAGDGGGFTSLASQTPGQKINAPARRYLRYVANFATSVSSQTPTLASVVVSAASTGTWRSPELFLSNAMTSWGLFQADRTVTGNAASIAYAMAISTYAGGTASTGTIVVTPGSTIAHSTGAYVMILSTYTVWSASETAKDDVLVVNWNEGSASKSATMAVYKNRLHLCAQSATGSINDTCFVRDKRGAWVRWTGVNARFLNVVNRNFVVGGSSETSGGYIYKLYDTDSDDGSAISAYYETKDMVLGTIQNRKAVDRLYLLGSNDSTTITATVKGDGGLASSAFSVDLSTGAGFKVKSLSVPSSPNGNTFRLRFENNAASKPWSIYGYGILFRDLGLMQ